MASDRTAAKAPHNSASAALPSTARLLQLGGDHRIIGDVDGANAYGCAPAPDSDLFAFGSSTASTISHTAFAAADDLRSRLYKALDRAPPAAVYEAELDTVRSELLALCGLAPSEADLIMAPSGTDLHMLVTQLLRSRGSRPMLAIIAEESETGSGVAAALAGQRYSPRSPLGADLDQALQGGCGGGDLITGSVAAEVVSVAARRADGGLRGAGCADAEVEALVADAVQDGRRVLLVVTDVSKTGLVSPSPACARDLADRFGEQVTVLVDACQMRLSQATLRAYVGLGWLVAISGSKFLTGPAYSGALVVPAARRASLHGRRLPDQLDRFTGSADWPAGWAAAGTIRAGFEFRPANPLASGARRVGKVPSHA